MNPELEYMMKDLKIYFLNKPRRELLIGFIVSYSILAGIWAITNTYVIIGFVALLYLIWYLDAVIHCRKTKKKEIFNPVV